jgi:hypothetical protein
MNLGLSDYLKIEFPNYIPVKRPVINTENIPDPNWLSGFVAGEGSFDVIITKSDHKIGYKTQLRFRISQHIRDKKLMEAIANYLFSSVRYSKEKKEIKNIYKYPNQESVYFYIVNLSEINNIVIPFFEKNPIYGAKYLDYLDWLKIVEIMNEGSGTPHLKMEGLEKIRAIKSKMNSFRYL